jgi:flagellar assembly protein FliH
MSSPPLFAQRFDDGISPIAGGARRWHGPAPTGAAVAFSYPRLEPAPAAPSVPEREAPPPTFSEAELAHAVEVARRDAHAECEAKLRAEISASREHREVEALAAIGASMAACRETLAQALTARVGASRDLALAVARALAAKALALQPLADIEAMFREVLLRLEGQSWLEIRLPPDLVATGEAALARAAAAAGFQGAFRVVAEPGLGPGDARLAWQDGMAERDLARLDAEATALVEAWLPTASEPPTPAGPAVAQLDDGRMDGFER